MILDRIVTDNLAELEEKKRRVPLGKLRELAEAQALAKDFASALRGERVRLIAEVKKASPSRGIIRADFHPVEIARTYAENGAAAISVLTEPRYFQGSLEYLRDIKQVLREKCPPLLRKDFLLDPYQLYESRAYGADAILLIVAILDTKRLKELLDLSYALGMSCLVEVHSEKEVAAALKAGAEVIGINNRDLATFKVDLATTERLRPLIPSGKMVVSESGISQKGDIIRLQQLGVNAVLVGETLMSAPDIGAKMKELMP